MNVGDYVRTKKGNIFKITGSDIEFASEIGSDGELPFDEKIINPNIIDLIEPQDLLYIDIDDGYAGGIIVPRIPETQAELDEMIELIKNNTWILKGIVTHEQLEEMEYKI